jgi:hypothetical protein
VKKGNVMMTNAVNNFTNERLTTAEWGREHDKVEILLQSASKHDPEKKTIQEVN